jgi:hypothetical protein
MKKHKKSFIIIILTIGVIFLINSRRVDKVTFDIMVLLTQDDIIETCHENEKFRLGLVKEKPSLYYTDIDLNELCNDKEKIKEVAEQKMEEFFKRNWQFVY